MKKTILIVIAFLAVMLMVLPTWAYVDVNTGINDTNFEMYGPHIDRIFIKMYSSMGAEFIGCGAGEIDVCDWPLDKANYDLLSGNPNVNNIYYPPTPSERGYYEFAINVNNETTLGPPGPLDPNPCYPTPTADVWLRRAMAYEVNRTYIEHDVLQGFGIMMYSEICPYMTAWLNSGLSPGGDKYDLTHPFNNATANAILDAHGYPLGGDGWRHPAGGSGHWYPDPAHDALQIYVRQDTNRKLSGDMLCNNLVTNCKIPVEEHYVSSGQAYVICMIEKDFHVYTGGWIYMGPEPDYLYDLHHIDSYWHDPESAPPNYQRIDDPELNSLLYAVKYGAVITGPDFNYPTYPTPVTKYVNSSVWRAEEVMEDKVYDYPIFATLGVKATHKTYTDPGKPYTGQTWQHIVNEQGFGTNSYWSFMNGYAAGSYYSDGVHDMIMQYGWKEQDMPGHLNMLYSEWYWDSEVMAKIYDGLAVRNPNAPAQYLPWMVNYFAAGTYLYKGTTASKVTINLKTGIKFNDGVDVTINDVIFSLVDTNKLLLAKGYSPGWWYPSVQHIVSYTVIDPLTVELLLDVQSAWATLWCVLAPPILPEHVWRSLITTGDPTTFMPDANMVGSSAFKWVNASYVPGATAELVANKEFFRYLPIMGEFNTTSPYAYSRQDPGYPQKWKMVTVDFVLKNLWVNIDPAITELDGEKYIYVDGQLKYGPIYTVIQHQSQEVEVYTFNLSKCYHEIKLAFHISSPPELASGIPNPWLSRWINTTLPIWVTLKYDIAGGKYLGVVTSPDCKVDGKDNAFVAGAYNTVPGDARWKGIADVTGDYKVDGKDVAWIAKYYGKW